jgi:hypothetical protein
VLAARKRSALAAALSAARCGGLASFEARDQSAVLRSTGALLARLDRRDFARLSGLAFSQSVGCTLVQLPGAGCDADATTQLWTWRFTQEPLVVGEGGIEGRNTDGIGFMENLKAGHAGFAASHGPVVVLGAGGAAPTSATVTLNFTASPVQLLSAQTTPALAGEACICATRRPPMAVSARVRSAAADRPAPALPSPSDDTKAALLSSPSRNCNGMSTATALLLVVVLDAWHSAAAVAGGSCRARCRCCRACGGQGGYDSLDS